jgi:hypothetical protein
LSSNNKRLSRQDKDACPDGSSDTCVGHPATEVTYETVLDRRHQPAVRQRTPIDDGKGAWNNTMSHPAADHYLGDTIAFPRIVARFGVSDRVDVGAWAGINPRSNYGMLGVDTKVALLTQGATWPVSVSIRPSVTSLLGPSELWAGNASVDVSVSRSFGRISPYGGVAASASLAVERSDDVNLDPATVQDGVVYAGVSYRWRALILSAEGRKGVAGQLRVPPRHAILSPKSLPVTA